MTLQMLSVLIVLVFASYGFAIGVQMLRGKYLNFKPFSCIACLSFWFSLVWLLIIGRNIFDSATYALAVTCITYFMSLIDSKLRSNTNTLES